MGRKKRKWAKWRARQKAPGIGRLVAWAEWEEGGERDANKKEACPCEGQATS